MIAQGRQMAADFISSEEEITLIRLYQSGDNKALADLLEAHAGYINQLARQWYGRLKKWFEFEDCFQTAVVGAIIASRRFDCESGNRWTTYATWWIVQCLRRMRSHGSVIHIPDTKHTDPNALKLQKVISIDFPVGDSEIPLRSLLEEVCDRDEQERIERCEIAQAALATLPDRSRKVVLDRLSGKVLQEIGFDIGVCRDMVRQIENKALLQLRHWMESRGEVTNLDLGTRQRHKKRWSK